MKTDKYHQLEIMETLAADPEITQADLAAKVGVAVGTVNWYLKQWSQKGLLKIRRISRWRWEYILTPKGLTEKTRLAGKYLEHSMRVYRRTREQAREILAAVVAAEYTQVWVDAQGDLADIFELSCLEAGVTCLPTAPDESRPTVKLEGTRFILEMPAEHVPEGDL